VQQIVAGDFEVNEENQNRIVEFIMQATEQQIAQVMINEVQQEQRKRVMRRINFMVHPDKCNHVDAKNAFQKLSSSSFLSYWPPFPLLLFCMFFVMNLKPIVKQQEINIVNVAVAVC